jgi:uncharacterized protein (TIGR00369 family)
MDKKSHYQSLINMYAAAPINKYYHPTMEVKEGEAVIRMEIKEQFHHSGGAVHGSVYFKMLDDAAYFAANSLEDRVFLLTISFTTYLTRPVVHGTLRSVGRVVNQNNSQFIAQSVLYDSDGYEVGRGSGVFVRGKIPLSQAKGYSC